MKELLTRIASNGAIILLIIAVLYILFLRECKQPPPCPLEDEIIVKKVDWQSMIDLANKPAVTHIDTVYIKGTSTTIIPPILPTPNIDGQDTTITIYNDSLVRDDINVTYDFKVRGQLLNRKWHYTPIITEIRRTDTIYVPKLIEILVPVKVPKNGLYAYGMAGGNANSFLFGGGLDFITKKNTEIGYVYQRFGSINIHNIKVGIKIW